jgi:hypothetical protein
MQNYLWTKDDLLPSLHVENRAMDKSSPLWTKDTLIKSCKSYKYGPTTINQPSYLLKYTGCRSLVVVLSLGKR